MTKEAIVDELKFFGILLAIAIPLATVVLTAAFLVTIMVGTLIHTILQVFA